MGINKQSARIKHHTSTTTGSFTVPASEDFTDGSWDKWDLAKSEIAVNEADDTVSVRIKNNVFEFYTTANPLTSDNIGNADLTIDSAGERKLIMAGALSTDKFTIKNSADTQELVSFNGDGTFRIGQTGTNNYMSYNGTTFYAGKSTSFIAFEGTSSRIYNAGRNFTVSQTTGDFHHSMSSGGAHFYQGTFQLNAGLNATSGAVNAMLIANGTAPTVNKTNCSWWYSDDIVAGNSAPHFRTEAGDIIKLYKEAALTASDGTTLANVITRMDELEARLQNQGLLT